MGVKTGGLLYKGCGMNNKDIIKQHFKPVKSLFLRRIKAYVGICPFHEEKTGSCHYREDKDEFLCFGCLASGDGKALAEALRRRNEQHSNNSKATWRTQTNAMRVAGGEV